MFWKIIKNIVFYLFLIGLISVALYYFWAPRYYFPESEVFYGKKIFNPYQINSSTQWQRVGIDTRPVWYEDLIQRLTGDEEPVFIDRNYYDTLLVAGNQRIVNENQPVYKQGVFHDDHFVIGCDKIEWHDYPFFRDIHNKQYRINKIHSNGCLLYLKPSAFFVDYSQDHPQKLQNYNGLMVDESFEQAVHLWDRALSAGKYKTLLAKALPKNQRFKPEKQYRIIYIPQNDTTLEYNLRQGNYFMAAKFQHNDNSVSPRKLRSLLSEVTIKNDTLIVSTKSPAFAINFFTQDGDIRKVVQDTEKASYHLKRNDTYIRTEIVFEDGTRYYLNPVHRYNGKSPHDYMRTHQNTFKTWLFRGMGIFGTIIVVWILLYIKRRLKIEIREPKS